MTNTVTLDALSENITITNEADETITVLVEDLTGNEGQQGIAGPGVASGGTINQLLKKTSSVNYETDWASLKTVNLNSLLGTGDVAVQGVLVSGTSIKTINSVSLLGSGDVAVQAVLVSGMNIKSINGSSLLGSGDLTIDSMVYPGAGLAKSTGTAWDTSIVDNSTNWNTAYGWGDHAGLYALLAHNHSGVYQPVGSYQATLVSGSNIKTINSTSLLGSGDITISATMVYPAAGIPLSTGAAWGSSITNNSANWDTAYGWGNHASAGYQAMLVNQTNIKSVNGNSLLGSGDLTITSMVYPGAGIAISTGSAWGSSIADNSTNWNTAYGWGNHASGGYLTSQTSHADVLQDGDFTSQGIMLRGASAGVYSILADNSTNWNTAYGWGNHSGLYVGVGTAWLLGGQAIGVAKNFGATDDFAVNLIQNNTTRISLLAGGGTNRNLTEFNYIAAAPGADAITDWRYSVQPTGSLNFDYCSLANAAKNGGTWNTMLGMAANVVTYKAGQVWKPSADSTGAFKFQRLSDSAEIWSVDSLNCRVGIGTVVPSQILEIKKEQDAGTLVSLINLYNGSSAYAGFILTTIGGNSFFYRTSNIHGIPDSFIIHEQGGGNIVFQGAAEIMRLTNSGLVGIGTTSPTTLLQLANNNWISEKDFAGTGTVNMFKVNVSDTIDVGATMNISGYVEAPLNGGALTFFDMPVSAAAAIGTEESLTGRLGSTNIMKWYCESDGAGGIQNIRTYNYGDFYITEAKNIVLGTTTGTKIGTATTQKLAFYNSAPIVQPIACTGQLTSITHTAPGTPDYLLQDLIDSSVGACWGFATHDEGNTLLSVVANLQVRVLELTQKLNALGLTA